MTPCPDCRRLHIHSLHCPNPQPLPRYATVLLIEPHELGAGVLEVPVRAEEIEGGE